MDAVQLAGYPGYPAQQRFGTSQGWVSEMANGHGSYNGAASFRPTERHALGHSSSKSFCALAVDWGLISC